jgi:hypothetical protein
MESNPIIKFYELKIKKVAETFGVPESEILEMLENMGMPLTDLGHEILMSDTTTDACLRDLFLNKYSGICKGDIHILKAFAVKTLKQAMPSEAKVELVLNSEKKADLEENLVKTIKDLFPPPLANRKDKELLEEFAKTEELSIGEELHSRAKGQRFLILNSKKEIDIELSLQVLRTARKGIAIPTVYPLSTGLTRVHHVSGFRSGRLAYEEESPFAPGKPLVEGWCLVCEEDFRGIPLKVRQFLRLVLNYTESAYFKNDKFKKFDVFSMSDRRSLMASARSGLESLIQAWPSVALIFEEAEALGTLPSLRLNPNSLNPVEGQLDPFKVTPNTHKNY